MGWTARERSRRLGAKLVQIRQARHLTQAQMLVTLKLDKKVFASAIRGYELGTREPPLTVLLRYARLMGVSTDVLIDDELGLPNKMPGAAKAEIPRLKVCAPFYQLDLKDSCPRLGNVSLEM